MASSYGTTPTENDLTALEGRLTAFYHELPPAQQELLDTIIAAGLSLLTPADTAGYLAVSGGAEVRAMHEAHLAELRASWQQAQVQPDDGAATQPAPRWSLRPLLDWLRRPSEAT